MTTDRNLRSLRYAYLVHFIRFNVHEFHIDSLLWMFIHHWAAWAIRDLHESHDWLLIHTDITYSSQIHIWVTSFALHSHQVTYVTWLTPDLLMNYSNKFLINFNSHQSLCFVPNQYLLTSIYVSSREVTFDFTLLCTPSLSASIYTSASNVTKFSLPIAFMTPPVEVG